ncbi:MAG: acetyltransferase [Proteobacteria bacterium]|nr:acetyltransferase [Pseudomonadota bacterium]
MAMRSVVIVNAGSGGQASVIFDACHAAELPVAGWLSADADAGNPGSGLIRLGDIGLLDNREFVAQFAIIIGAGSAAFRRSLSLKVLSFGGILATVIHPAAVVSQSAEIGSGSFLAANAVAGVRAKIGRFCIVNTGATIDHDNVLDDGVNIAPGVHFAGGVHVGEDAFIGVGASVVPGVRIGARATVGAGAVVIRDVAPDTTVVGNPAKPLVKRYAGISPI